MDERAPEPVAHFRVNGAFRLPARSAYVVHGAVEGGEVRAGNFLAVPYDPGRLADVYTGTPIQAVEFVRLSGEREDVALVLACLEREARLWDALIAQGQRLEVWPCEPSP